MNNERAITCPGATLGIGWGFLYGYQHVPAPRFLPELRQLGAGLTKVNLFWNQVEPQRGEYDWQAVDAYVQQLADPEEGWIALFSSSLWAARRPAALLPGSPANDPEDYYRFVHDLVKRCTGRVRYWQNDAEPNNPVFWAGTEEDYGAQLKVFYRAVKDADPAAVVVVGGYDGLFNPPGMPPFPNQQAGLDFFDFVLRAGAGAFDLFDMHLYNDPYTIPACVDFMRQKIAASGNDVPIVSSEYGGPGFFAFAENRQYLPLITSWAQSGLETGEQGLPGQDSTGKGQIEALYQNMADLPPQTQMFMQGCPLELQARFERIQARDLVIRTVLGLSAGAQKMIYWQLLAGSGPRDDLMDLMYGKIGMLEFEDGKAARRRPLAEVYGQMVKFLAGVSQVMPIDCPDQPSIYLFKVERREREPGFVLWERREPFSGEDLAPTAFQFTWKASSALAIDALGELVNIELEEGEISLPVTGTPIYLEPDGPTPK